MKKIFISAVFGITACMSLGYAMQRPSDGAIILGGGADVNAEANIGVTTSMNGNSSTTGGTAISSTSASKESRSASGNGD